MATKTKTKTFDCVEMKRRAQEQLQAEYKAKESEYSSIVDFLNAKAKVRRSRRASAHKSS